MPITKRGVDPAAGILPAQLEAFGIPSALFGAILSKPEVRWVDGNATASTAAAADVPGFGLSLTRNPWATVAYAVTQASANSLILVAPGHTEDIDAADDWPFANAGVYVIGMGAGTARPTFTFTATASTILLDTANHTIGNMRFLNDIASLVTMFSLTAAGNRIIGNDLIMDLTNKNALIGIGLDSAAADRCVISHNRIESDTIGANVAIGLAAACDRLEIAHNLIDGDFADACIDSGAIATKVDIHHNRLTNTQSGDHAIEFSDAVTGSITYNTVNTTLAATATKTAIDPGSCLCLENYGSDGVGDISGILNPIADA